jgi:hypothetical protein
METFKLYKLLKVIAGLAISLVLIYEIKKAIPLEHYNIPLFSIIIISSILTCIIIGHFLRNKKDSIFTNVLIIFFVIICFSLSLFYAFVFAISFSPLTTGEGDMFDPPANNMAPASINGLPSASSFRR